MVIQMYLHLYDIEIILQKKKKRNRKRRIIYFLLNHFTNKTRTFSLKNELRNLQKIL